MSDEHNDTENDAEDEQYETEPTAGELDRRSVLRYAGAMSALGVVGTPASADYIEAADTEDEPDSRVNEDDIEPEPVEPEKREVGVLVIADCRPWTVPLGDIVPPVNTYAVINSDQIIDHSLSDHEVILLPSAQSDEYYENLVQAQKHLTDFVFKGGTLIAHTADGGWPCDGKSDTPFLPGNVETNSSNYESLDIYGEHPVVDGISEEDLEDWSASAHGYFTNIPDTATEIIGSGTSFLADTTYIEYPVNDGTVLATTQPFEWPRGDGAEHVPDTQIAKTLLSNELEYILRPTADIDLEAPTAVEVGDRVRFTITVEFPEAYEIEDHDLDVEAEISPASHDGSGATTTETMANYAVLEDETEFELRPQFEDSEMRGMEYDVSIDVSVSFDVMTFDWELEFKTYTFDEVRQVDIVPIAAADADIHDEDFHDPAGEALFDQLRMLAERANEFFASGLGTMGAKGANFRFPTKGAEDVDEQYDIVTFEAGWLVLPFTRDEYLSIDSDTEDPSLGEDLDPPLDPVPPWWDPEEDDYNRRNAPWIHSTQLTLLSDAIDPVVNRPDVDTGSVMFTTERRFNFTRAAWWSWVPDHEQYDGELYDTRIWDRAYGRAWLHELGHEFGFPDLYPSESPHGTEIGSWGQMHRGDQFTAYVRAVNFAGRDESDWLDIGPEQEVSFDEEVILDNLGPLSDMQFGDSLQSVRSATTFPMFGSEPEWISNTELSVWILEPRRAGETSIKKTNLRDLFPGDYLQYSPADTPGIAVYEAGELSLDDPDREGYLDYVSESESPTLPELGSIYYDSRTMTAFERLDDDIESGGSVKIWQTSDEPVEIPGFLRELPPMVTFEAEANHEWLHDLFDHEHEDETPPPGPLPGIDVFVETDDGDRAGTDPNTGEVYEEIDGARVTHHGSTQRVRLPVRDDLSVTISGRRLAEQLEKSGHSYDGQVVYDRMTIVDTAPTIEEANGTQTVRGRVGFESTVSEDPFDESQSVFASGSAEVEPSRVNADSPETITAYVALEDPFGPHQILEQSGSIGDVHAESEGGHTTPPIEERDGEEVAVLTFDRDSVVDALGPGIHEVAVSGVVGGHGTTPFVTTTELAIFSVEYTTDGVVDTDGLTAALEDWRTGDIDAELLVEVITAWRSQEPIE